MAVSWAEVYLGWGAQRGGPVQTVEFSWKLFWELGVVECVEIGWERSKNTGYGGEERPEPALLGALHSHSASNTSLFPSVLDQVHILPSPIIQSRLGHPGFDAMSLEPQGTRLLLETEFQEQGEITNLSTWGPDCFVGRKCSFCLLIGQC